MRTICGYSIEEFLRKVEEFHGYPAPGLLIGGCMVDLARRNLPVGEFFDVICETRVCLPDAVQILTPCTCGNGWLKVLPVGRFALTFFEKNSGSGIRVYIDAEKLERYTEIKNWFFRLKPKKEQDEKLLKSQILESGDDIYSIAAVVVDESHLSHKHNTTIVLCAFCGEAFPGEDEEEELCLACRGLRIYRQEEKKLHFKEKKNEKLQKSVRRK